MRTISRLTESGTRPPLMKTTKPYGADGVADSTLVAANEPTMPQAAQKERALQSGPTCGWDPYDVWRTRVKTPRETGTPAL